MLVPATWSIEYFNFFQASFLFQLRHKAGKACMICLNSDNRWHRGVRTNFGRRPYFLKSWLGFHCGLIFLGSPEFQHLCLEDPKTLNGSAGGPMSCRVPGCLVCSPSFVAGDAATLGEEADQGSAIIQGSSFKAALAASSATVDGG